MEHPHPRRHKRALRSSLLVAGVGAFIWLVGMVFLITDTREALLISLIVIGVTMMLLAPVWYFTYMEKLEPGLYSPDSPQESTRTVKDEERRS